MNKDLLGRTYKLPEDIISHLKFQVANKNINSDGIKRATTLINDGQVNYNQLKRILYDLKNIDKNQNIDKYNLYGGELMDRWGNMTINNDQDLIKSQKQSRKQSDSIGAITGERTNAFLKTHTKKTNTLPPINAIKSNSDKNSVSSLKLGKLFEEILKN